jgi:hypothetical protein
VRGSDMMGAILVVLQHLITKVECLVPSTEWNAL